jgi:hypothetical protein
MDTICDNCGQEKGRHYPIADGKLACYGTGFQTFKAHEPDDCQVCLGKRGGVKGNENIVDGVVMCDFCAMDVRRTGHVTKSDQIDCPKCVAVQEGEREGWPFDLSDERLVGALIANSENVGAGRVRRSLEFAEPLRAEVLRRLALRTLSTPETEARPYCQCIVRPCPGEPPCEPSDLTAAKRGD